MKGPTHLASVFLSISSSTTAPRPQHALFSLNLPSVFTPDILSVLSLSPYSSWQTTTPFPYSAQLSPSDFPEVKRIPPSFGYLTTCFHVLYGPHNICTSFFSSVSSLLDSKLPGTTHSPLSNACLICPDVTEIHSRDITGNEHSFLVNKLDFI